MSHSGNNPYAGYGGRRALLGSLRPFLVGVWLLLSPTWLFAADGKALFSTCTTCHGARGEGNPKLGAPNIAGMDAWYVERQLENFATGRRGTVTGDTYGAQMKAAVAVLPGAAERQAVAAHIAGLPQVGAGKTAMAGAKPDLNNGKTQYNALCGSCHQANGLGNKALGAPRLAGVDAVYLARQLSNFRSGARGAHPDDKTGKQMAAMGKLLKPDADKDTLAYIGSLKP